MRNEFLQKNDVFSGPVVGRKLFPANFPTHADGREKAEITGPPNILGVVPPAALRPIWVNPQPPMGRSQLRLPYPPGGRQAITPPMRFITTAKRVPPHIDRLLSANCYPSGLKLRPREPNRVIDRPTKGHIA